MYDILIKNSRIFNGESFEPMLADIAIQDNIITEISPCIDESAARIVVDSNGAYASSGFTDIHAHVYPVAELGVHPESAFFPYCITAVADGGSAGCENIVSGMQATASCRVDIKYFINVAPAGLATLRCHPEYISPEYINCDKIRKLVKAYPNQIIGIKIRMGAEVVREYGIEPLVIAADLAHELGVRLMVHCTNPPVSMDEIASYLKAGDIMSHAFHGIGNTIIGNNGKVTPKVKEAKQRGVIFDIGDAGAHLSFDVLRSACADNVFPDTISTDITNKGVFNPKVFCLPFVMSKLLSLGFSLEYILKHSTFVPAKITGTTCKIARGSSADIVLFRLEDCALSFVDSQNISVTGNKLIRPLLTVKDGTIVWRDMSF